MAPPATRPVDIERNLGDLVAELPARARVLERAGIDYCCHGRRTLADACASAGLDPLAVASELGAITDPTDVDVQGLAPGALVDHIVERHHVYLHDELPALTGLADKVLAAHGQRHPELTDVARLVAEIRAELEPHLAKEEQVLFPAIHRLVDGEASPDRKAIDDPMREMEEEHEQAGALLAELRATTRDFEVPDDGCASYRSLYERLTALEADTFRHIHLENNVLVPALAAWAP
jgi:regulator of cell morphogenesis and NO signaling